MTIRYYTYEEGQQVEREFDEAFPPPPEPPEPTPEEARAALPPITRRQLRLTLRREAGITTDAVESIIASIEDEDEREDALIEWEDASTYERMHPMLLAIADALSLTPEAVDDLWVKAMEA